MTTYYRTTDGSLHELTEEQYAALLVNGKAAILRAYSVDPQPQPLPSQYVQPGPLAIDDTSARRTWVLVDKSAEQMAAELRIVVTPRQIRHAVNAAGLRAPIEAAVAAADQDTKDWWEFATSFESDHPILLAMAGSLGMTEAQVYSIFETARGL